MAAGGVHDQEYQANIYVSLLVGSDSSRRGRRQYSKYMARLPRVTQNDRTLNPGVTQNGAK